MKWLVRLWRNIFQRAPKITKYSFYIVPHSSLLALKDYIESAEFKTQNFLRPPRLDIEP